MGQSKGGVREERMYDMGMYDMGMYDKGCMTWDVDT